MNLQSSELGKSRGFVCSLATPRKQEVRQKRIVRLAGKPRGWAAPANGNGLGFFAPANPPVLPPNPGLCGAFRNSSEKHWPARSVGAVLVSSCPGPKILYTVFDNVSDLFSEKLSRIDVTDGRGRWEFSIVESGLLLPTDTEEYPLNSFIFGGNWPISGGSVRH